MSIENCVALARRGVRVSLWLAVIGLLAGCTFYVGGRDAGTRDGEAMVVPVGSVQEVC